MSSGTPPDIPLTRARLRPWREGDEESLVRHANNRKVWRNLRDSFPHPYTREDARAWIAFTQGSTELHWAIEVDEEAAGGIGLRRQQDVGRHSAEIGYWLGEAHWGKGIATEAVRAVTAYGFAHLNVVRIYARIFAWNPASVRVAGKAGYQFEGRLRKAVTKDGETIDALVYAVVSE